MGARYCNSIWWKLSMTAPIAVLALAANALAQSCYNNTNINLVRNGGFESPARNGASIPGWTVTWPNSVDGKPVDPYVTVDDDNPHTGASELKLGTEQGTNDIWQRISGTQSPQVYTVCFWLSSAPNLLGGHTSFSMLWNNVSQLDLTNSGPSPYQYYSFNVVGTGLDYLRFRERNDSGYYFLDDVSVQLCSGCSFAASMNHKWKH